MTLWAHWTRRSRALLIALCAALAAIGIAFAFRHLALLPKIDGFDPDGGAWTAFGGAWELRGATMRNTSDERGAKLVAGSALWKDYSLEADIALLGSFGDAGLLLRANDIGQGVDSYRGYFVGLRNEDDALIVGRSDYAWEEYQSLILHGGVRTGQLYHLHLVAVGCSIGIEVRSPDGSVLRTGVQLANCLRSGRIGLQSYQTPALWQNFRVAPATASDLNRLLQGTPLSSEKDGTLHRVVPEGSRRNSMLRDATLHVPYAPATPIVQLRLPGPDRQKRLSIRGVVRLLAPAAYLEDSTGGVHVEFPPQETVAVGEEVEMEGALTLRNGYPLFKADLVRDLSSSSAMPSRLVGAFEAATGAVDSRLVTLQGTLLRHWINPDGQLVMELTSAGELFRAIVQSNRYGEHLPSLQRRSELQLTGVVTSDTQFAGDTAFAVLVSSNQDALRVLQAPPWWTPAHILVLAVLLLGVAVTGLLLVQRLRERTLLQILAERELLAHDLHDTVAQSFAGISYQLRALEDSFTGPEAQHSQLLRAQGMVRESHQELRRSITTLRTDVNNLNDLAEGLHRIARRSIGDGKMKLVWECRALTQRVPLPIADCFFRIGQEAISNAVLHANASQLSVSLRLTGRKLVLEICDDGCGLPTPAQGTGNGLYGMKRRAELVGALFKVSSGQHGTVVHVESELPRAPSLWLSRSHRTRGETS